MPSTSEPAELWDDARILALRPPKNSVDPSRPYAFLVEPERTRAGTIADTAVVFLTNRECPFRCLMCDLWKNTTGERVPDGAIAKQLAYALTRMPAARHIKLYNAGNFFDAQAIPPGDWPRIVELLNPFETVIIESHPRLIGPSCLTLRDRLRAARASLPALGAREREAQDPLTPNPSPPKRGRGEQEGGQALQVAMGLETVHPDVLPRLNKRMTLADFEKAARFLCDQEIVVRAFILLRPPFLDEAEGVHWAKESLRFAFDAGVECCVVIPTRAGNGAMEELQRQGDFAPPRLDSLEEVLDHGIGMRRGRVFVDLWDVERFYECQRCGPARTERLRTMNLTQQWTPRVVCSCWGVG